MRLIRAPISTALRLSTYYFGPCFLLSLPSIAPLLLTPPPMTVHTLSLGLHYHPLLCYLLHPALSLRYRPIFPSSTPTVPRPLTLRYLSLPSDLLPLSVSPLHSCDVSLLLHATSLQSLSFAVACLLLTLPHPTSNPTLLSLAPLLSHSPVPLYRFFGCPL